VSSCLPFNVHNVQSNVIYYIFTHTVVLVILNVVHFVSDHCRQMLWHSHWRQRRVSPAYRCSDSERRHTRIFIVGDTAVTKVPKTNILSATLLLLVSNYVFDLEYSRFYANLLGVLQTDNYVKDTSKQLKSFITKLCCYGKFAGVITRRLTTSYPVTLIKS